MTGYELTIEFESVGVKQEEMSGEELAEWLDRIAAKVRQDTTHDMKRFKVEREE